MNAAISNDEITLELIVVAILIVVIFIYQKSEEIECRRIIKYKINPLHHRIIKMP